MAMTIKCPKCRSRLQTRRSNQVTDALTKSEMYCPSCFTRCDVLSECSNVKTATWVTDASFSQWNKPGEYQIDIDDQLNSEKSNGTTAKN